MEHLLRFILNKIQNSWEQINKAGHGITQENLILIQNVKVNTELDVFA